MQLLYTDLSQVMDQHSLLRQLSSNKSIMHMLIKSIVL